MQLVKGYHKICALFSFG